MKISVLDHGYVEFIEAWGGGKAGQEDLQNWAFQGTESWTRDFETGIIEAARQSTQGAFRGWERGECSCDVSAMLTIPGEIHKYTCPYITQPGDKKLLQFLYSHKHFTPFEFSGMVIEVQAPIFVFREWHRHRTQSYNEMSARYAPLPDLYYQPTRENLVQRLTEANLTRNKQSQAMEAWNDETVDGFLTALRSHYDYSEQAYKAALADGIPKELARLVMPVGHYSKMRASANLRNWLQFMTLRCDTSAQWEIRQFAEAVASLIASHFPRTYNLWRNEEASNGFQETTQVNQATKGTTET